MKKIIAGLLLLVGAVFLVACSVKQYFRVSFENCDLKSYTVEKGSHIEEPDPVEKDGYTFVGWFADAALSEAFDFSQEILADVTIYAGFEEDTVEPETHILGVSMPRNFVSYNTNKGEQTNKRTEFFDKDLEFVVGSDNAAKFKPVVSFVSYNPKTEEVTPIVVNDWEYDVKVYLGDTEVSANADYVASIDKTECLVKFGALALGESFTVKVAPTGLTESQIAKGTFVISVEVKVVEGFNVYSALDLAYIDNRTEGEEATWWQAFRAEKGLSQEFNSKALILQDDIRVTVEDIPAGFVYQENEINKLDADYARTVGSLKDSYEIYFRNIAENDEFKIIGNYFKIDASSLPEVTRENGQITAVGEVISHASLFRFEGVGELEFANTYLIGNSPRIEDNIKAGGIIMHKVQGPVATFKNLIAICWFIAFFPNADDAPYLAEDCKAYDCFNSFIYNWGSKDATFKNCEMIGAGGPIIIEDHVDPQAADGGRVSSTAFIDCHLDSHVVGTEGWFTVVKAVSMVPVIKSLDAFFTPFGRSFLSQSTDGTLSYLNLMAVVKSGSAQSITAEKIQGTIVLNNHSFDFGATNPYLAALLEQTFVQGAPAFETDTATLAGGYCYGTTTGLYDLTNNQIVDPANAIYTGDYLCIYYNGMAFILGYNAAGAVYSA